MLLNSDGQPYEVAHVCAVKVAADKTLEMVDLQTALGAEPEYIEINRLVLMALAKWAQQSTAHFLAEESP